MHPAVKRASNCPRRFPRNPAAWLLSAILVFALALDAAPTVGKILFLHLRLKNGQLTLVQSVIRPGILKLPREPDAAWNLEYELVSGQGVVIATGAMRDPLSQPRESAPHDSAAQTTDTANNLTRTDFSVRIPAHPEAQTLRLYRINHPTSKAAQSNTDRQLVGEIKLPAIAEQP